MRVFSTCTVRDTIDHMQKEMSEGERREIERQIKDLHDKERILRSKIHRIESDERHVEDDQKRLERELEAVHDRAKKLRQDRHDFEEEIDKIEEQIKRLERTLH
jgi:chromosome segregation ATPase